ncbi:MAG: sterol desaturase family protein [Oligoflexus sp.]
MIKFIHLSEAEQKPLPSWLNNLCIGAAIGSLLWLERKLPLRRSVEPKLRHDARNFVMAASTALTIRLTEKPLAMKAMALSDNHRIGLLHRFKAPAAVKSALAVVMLDYTLYVWHVLTHKVPFLWRFHQVHHVDLDLTATTAIRFHFGEMAISAIYRSGQVFFIGASPRALNLWQTLTLIEILFHHSNVKLPMKWERLISAFVVTPRMHAIHHSTRQDETDSNWSSGMSIWDRLHRTLRLDVPQERIRIGVPAYGESSELKLWDVLSQPFRAQRQSWQDYELHPRIRYRLGLGACRIPSLEA